MFEYCVLTDKDNYGTVVKADGPKQYQYCLLYTSRPSRKHNCRAIIKVCHIIIASNICGIN